MKKTIKKYYILLLLAVSIVSCDKMLDVDSERVVFEQFYSQCAKTFTDSRFPMLINVNIPFIYKLKVINTFAEN